MKHKTWFRLVLKAIGVLTVGTAIPVLIWSGTEVALSVWGVGSGLGMGEMMISYFVGSAAQVIFGLYLFFGGEWIVNMVIPSNRPYCPNCGYDVSRATSGRCPECGVALPSDSDE